MTELPIRRSDLFAWGTVRAGLALTLFGGLLFFLCAVLLAVVRLSQDPEGSKVPLLVLVLVSLGIVGLVAGLVLISSGVCMTASAPSWTGARTLGILATICGLVFLILCVVLALAGLDGLGREFQAVASNLPPAVQPATKPLFAPGELRALLTIQGVSFVVGTLCYLLALRALAASLDRKGVALGVLCYLLLVMSAFGGTAYLVHKQLTEQGPLNLSQLETAVKLILGGVVTLGLLGLVAVALVRRSITKGLLHEG